MQSIKFVVTTILFLLVGCAATGPRYEDSNALDSKASEIIVYRPDRFARGGNTFYVHLDGKEVAKLQNAGFAVIPTLPGPRELEIRSFALDLAFRPIKLVLNVTASNRVFVRFEPSLSGGVIVNPGATVIPVAYKFELVLEADARNELRTLRRSD